MTAGVVYFIINGDEDAGLVEQRFYIVPRDELRIVEIEHGHEQAHQTRGRDGHLNGSMQWQPGRIRIWVQNWTAKDWYAIPGQITSRSYLVMDRTIELKMLRSMYADLRTSIDFDVTWELRLYLHTNGPNTSKFEQAWFRQLGRPKDPDDDSSSSKSGS